MKATKDQKVASTTNGEKKKETVKLATSTNMRVTNKTKMKTKLCFHHVVLWHVWVYNFLCTRLLKKSDIQATGHNMYRNTL